MSNRFRVIVLSDGSEWAANSEGEGIFSRRRDGTWQQHTGTGQTPRFRSPQALSRYVHANYAAQDGERLARMISSHGWEVAS